MKSTETARNKKILFVVNPISGGIDKSEFIEELSQLSEKYSFDYKLYKTTGKEDSKKIKESIEEWQPDSVAAVGGDGTSNLVGQLLIDSDVVLNIVPFGSANGMATELDIPSNYENAIRIAVLNKVKKIDVLLINDKHYCLRISDIGINAKIIKRFEKSNKRGMLSYAKHFIEELIQSRPKKVSIKTDNEEVKKRVHMVALANATRYGTGAIINPIGSMTDGNFEVCLLKRISFIAFLHLIKTFMFGKLSGTEYLEILSCKEVVISFKKYRTLQMDGELLGKYQVVTATIKPQCLNISVQ